MLKLLGRLFIAAIFVQSAFYKLRDPLETENMIEKAGISNYYFHLEFLHFSLPSLAYFGAIVFLLFGSICLILGWKMRSGAFVLILYLVAVTWFYHYDFTNSDHLWAALQNLGLIGGLLYTIVAGPGKFSIQKE